MSLCNKVIIAIFITSACSQTIKKFGPEDTPPGWCLAPIDPGFCTGENVEWVRKWSYSKKWRRCLPYQYTGCGGMYLNRFNSWFECAIYCEYRLGTY